jgi:FkbM family methyltransferase
MCQRSSQTVGVRHLRLSMNTLKQTATRLLKPTIERFPGLVTFLRKRRDNRRLARAVRTPLGFVMQGNALMQSGAFEPMETELVQRLLRDVDTLVNVGANIGYYACIALQQGKSVIAFEPMPGNLHHLLCNLRHNGWERRAEVFPMALSDQSGIIDIYGGGTGASLVRGWANQPEQYVTQVSVNTAEQVLGNRLGGKRCLILVDVEGSENRFLAGASNLLRLEPSPTWLVEITIGEHLPRGVTVNPDLLSTFDKFFLAGYSAWAIGVSTRLVAREEVVAVATTGRDTLGTHNFVFSRDTQLLDAAILG